MLVDKLVLPNAVRGVIVGKQKLRIIELWLHGKGDRLDLTHANKIGDTKFSSHKSVLLTSH